MSLTLVQSAVKDPNPANIDHFDNGVASPHSNSTSNKFGSNTTSGNTLLCIPGIAWDTGNAVIYKVSDPVNGDWTSVGDQLNTTDCNYDVHPYVVFNAAPLLTTSWSGTASLAVTGILTLVTASGTMRLGQLLNGASILADTIIVSKISGTLGAAGSTYQLSANGVGITLATEAMTTTDFVRIDYTNTTGGDYQGSLIMEWTPGAGTLAGAGFSGNNDAPTIAGTDNVTSGTIAAGAVPGVLIGFGFNGGVANTVFAPTAGTGYTNANGAAILTFDQGQPLCRWTYQSFSNIGTRAVTFSTDGGSRYLTVAIALQDTGSVSSPVPRAALLGVGF